MAASRTRRQKSSEAYRLLNGTCPDSECQAKLYFPSYDKSVECTSCGQRHERASLKNVAEVTNAPVALHNLLKNILLGNVKPKKGADNVKVLGLSNYVCKLISPILTYYGMDRDTGKAKLLSDMGKGKVFDVSILGDRSFQIEAELLDVIGYGKDRSGSLQYLAHTLKDIESFNENELRLVPIHADGDGHCLVHAISRALVGRELFWHALRVNLKNHLTDNLDNYKSLFMDFVDKDEWELIIEECDPYYMPPEGEALGLRNIHIFGLANVLHRPIILLDSKEGMNSSGDYSGVFLPGLIPPENCRGKDGTLNKPLCIAWSSSGHNHYIPLVGIKGRGAAKLPVFMVQKSWGMPKEEINKYIEFDSRYRCSIGGDKCLTEKYLGHLVTTMEDIFQQNNDVNPQLVADVHQYIYKSSGIVGVQPTEVIERTKNAVRQKLLYRCLMCMALVEYILPKELFEKGGSLYNLAVSIHKKLDPNKMYSFPGQGAVCSYDEEKDCLIPDMERSHPKTCVFCSGEMLRPVQADGSVIYMDGDKTSTPAVGGRCPCGFKHYWQGKEYDNLPEMFNVPLQWAGKVVSEKIAWFQYESDPTLNSNVFEVAQAVVQKHFPGEFGSERLVQQVVDTILSHTAAANKSGDKKEGEEPRLDDPWSAEMASKIILTGQKKKAFHKEELTKSEAERNVRKKIQSQAAVMQQKKTIELAAQKHTKDREMKVSTATAAISGQTSAPQPIASTSSSMQAQPGEKKIRLATSDGRTATLNLVKDVTYTELQKLIYEAVNVPADRQRIRHGFPPKILGAPRLGQQEEESSVVPIQHGDKLALEILPELPASKPSGSCSASAQEINPHPAPANRHSGMWGSFEEDSHNNTADGLLQALKNTQHAGSDSIDTSIASLGILSAVSGKDMWTYVQSMPHLFSVGGLFYTQVNRDLGLTDGKHCQLPCLPGKIFRYNGDKDRLELCLEPYGHFPVEPRIEEKVQEGSFDQGIRALQEQVRFGASGAVHQGKERKAFSGQGHTLKAAEDRMPTDLACMSHRPHARGFHDLCNPLHARHESISEEPDNMQVDDEADKPDVVYQRLGPGYSTIDRASENAENANLQMLRAMAESIKQTLTEEMDEDDSQSESDMKEDSAMCTEDTEQIRTSTDTSNPSDTNAMVTDDNIELIAGVAKTISETSSSGDTPNSAITDNVSSSSSTNKPVDMESDSKETCRIFHNNLETDSNTEIGTETTNEATDVVSVDKSTKQSTSSDTPSVHSQSSVVAAVKPISENYLNEDENSVTEGSISTSKPVSDSSDHG